MKLNYFIVLALVLMIGIVNADEKFDDVIQKFKEAKLDTESYKVALPITVKIEDKETNENSILALGKEGNIVEGQNPDIIIRTNSDNLNNAYKIESDEDLIKFIENSEIKALTFKGDFIISFAEKELNVKIIKEKSFSQKVSGIFSSIIFKIKSLFS